MLRALTVRGPRYQIARKYIGKRIHQNKLTDCKNVASSFVGCTATNMRLTSTSAAPRRATPHLDSIKARGLYNKDVMKHLKTYSVRELTITNDGKLLKIHWEDNHISQFHTCWLRHNCHCPECRLDYNGMITVNFDSLDLDQLRIVGASMEGDDVLLVRWQDGATQHEGPLLAAWLRQNCYSEQADKNRRSRIAMTFSRDKTIPEVGYEDVIGSERGLYRWLSHLSERGVCLVTNVPKQTGMVQQVAQLIAPIQHTVYGETFDVVSTPKPVNAAYSPVKLDLHMDQVHYESPPGLQFLHCVEFDPDIVGGDNTFADIHEIAHKLREERPEFFNTLSRVPVTFQTVHYSRDYPVHLRIQRPIISLNHLNEIVAVFWHPLLVGPLQVHPNDVEPFYKAYKHFFSLINSYQSIYRIRMVAGDLISFNNRRVLHGRASYSNQKGTRHLQGTYVEISEFQSRLQVLHNKLGDGRPATRCGSLDWQ
ncbi:hypothetical protein BsWGS_20975 [Bradybaena similaris]